MECHRSPWTIFQEEHLRINVSGPHFERDWNEKIIPRVAHSSHIVEYPYNCNKCSDEVFRAIIEYNQTKRTEQFEKLDCKCKADWQREIGNPSPKLEHRIKDGTLVGEFSDVIIHFLNSRRKKWIIDI